jgi:hypothetical protein
MRNELAHLDRAASMLTPSPLTLARAKAVALCLLTACAISCRDKAPTPDKEPPAPGATASAATAIPSASAAADRGATASAIPTLALEKFAPADSHPSALFAVEGALVVVDGNRVGRIVGEGIEWIGKIPTETPALGENTIDAVYGLWPDGIAAVYRTSQGRAPQPTYFPLTGKGASYTVAEGGGFGFITGVARVGKSTILAGNSMVTNVALVTVRGPRLARELITPAQAGCKAGEVWQPESSPAISPSAFESSPEGTLVSIGRLCEKRGSAAEIWDQKGKSRIVDLGRWWKKVSYWPMLLKGNGDELWAFSDTFSPVLHYRNGEIAPVAALGRPIQNVFVSPRGQLHVSDGLTIYRHDDGKWIPIAHLAEPASFRAMAMDDKETIWASNGAVHKLREDPGVAVPEGCTTPFVYLYEVSSTNAKDFTFPSTQKALSTFAEVSALGLVEFEEGGTRRLGITVSSQAQGVAVVAHLKATMKDEDPRLFCYDPKAPRKIAMEPKVK